MASLGASFAHLFESSDTAKSHANQKEKSVHNVFISTQILPTTIKLQRELRGRKFREIQSKLKDAIKALQDFQNEEWPPSENDIDNYKKRQQQKKEQQKQQEHQQEDDDEMMDDYSMRSVSTATTSTTQQENESFSHVMDIPDDMSVRPDDPSDQTHDDPNTREYMHDAIVEALEAYIFALVHPSRSSKAVEYALECIQLFVSKRYVSGRAGGQDDLSGSGAKTIELWHQQKIELPPPSLLHQLIEAVTKCSETASESIQNALVKTMLSILTSPKCGVHEASLLLALRAVLHVYLVTKTNSVRESSKFALMDVIRSVFGRMEAYSIMLANSNNDSLDMGPADSVMDKEDLIALASQLNTDSYVIFRSLCKLSCKELPEDQGKESSNTGYFSSNSSGLDPMALRNKILSLELILSVMELCGKAFCEGEKFLYLVQHYLCVSLLKNCVSNHTQVAFLSQKIFLLVVYKFKGNLKQEIEVFMSNIFLRVLESPNSSFRQKALVLESLRSLCKDPVLLTQIFLNYDCDFDAMNLYKDIVHNLTKIVGKTTTSAYSSSNSNTTKKDQDEQFELSLAGVEVIVTILKAFLKASGLPGGIDENIDGSINNSIDDSAGAKIRGMLQLDIGMASRQHFPPPAISATSSSVSLDNNYGTNYNNYSNNNDFTQEGKNNKKKDIVLGGDDVNINNKDNITFDSTVEKSSSQQPKPKELNRDDLLGISSASSSSNVADQIVDAFDRKRNAEQNFEMGIVKFSLSLKSGLTFFIENGFVECDAKQIALFFLANKDKLEKTQIGEALGREPDAAFVKSKGDDIIDCEKGGPGFYVRILHHYANAMDFTGIMFDEAIRLFLSGFRLPGEAQKIDRIMEKFAEHYTLQNPSIFTSADTAFILAFSVIMLNTDLHNPSIKPERRMTLQSFIATLRGIGDNGADLPEDLLKGIYERIKKNPFSLKEDDAARERVFEGASSMFFSDGGASSFFSASSEERKRERFKKEREEMMAATAQLIRRRPTTNKNGNADSASKLTDSVAPADVVKPMFDVTWGPVIGILSQVLECSDDERSIAVCLNGFVYAIRLAAHSRMSLARDTFVTSLGKFTFLGSLKNMKRKNIESIRTLLSIAVIDGEFLGESWGSVLQCISQLARLRMSASGLDSDESFLMDSSLASSSPARRSVASRVDMSGDGGGLFRQQSRFEVARETEENNGKFVLESVNEVLIDKVFSSTVNLSAQSLAHFIEQLIFVSQSEIAGTSKSGITGVGSQSGGEASASNSIVSTTGTGTSSVPMTSVGLGIVNSSGGADGPSIFSLQRLVEVADYNIDVRPRLVWAQLWPKIADFFATIGSHENAMVSVFAMDSLKQLSLKFLDKPELSEFNFQRIFLSPFLRCLEDESTRDEIGELVLRCLDNIVRKKSHNLRSGWKTIFAIIARAANDRRDNIKFLGLAILQRLLDEHLDQLCHSGTSSQHKDAETAEEGNRQEQEHGIDVLSNSRTRNSDAEDFVGLCCASVSFVKSGEAESPRPSGLSMRALCHTAIYADVLAAQKVRPPLSGAQWTDPNSPGYTYEGLDDKEALEMVLWRHLFEGLADGVRSSMPSMNNGAGCLIQRGSILALRAIFTRHGHVFSVPQLKAILEQSLIPAIQSGAENDQTPVVGITSESPSISSIDFLAKALPLPPPADDSGLKKFETLAKTDSSEPKRPFGPAELLLEASFTDMRHGGEGDLRYAYLFAKKDIKPNVIEQPFPNSWVATTSTAALGLLTDIASEVILTLGDQGRAVLWPMIAEQYKLWCVGGHQWRPCEALVRVACGEISRLAERAVDVFPNFERDDAIKWTTLIFSLFSDILKESVENERNLQNLLRKAKSKERKARRNLKNSDGSDSSNWSEISLETPYGNGRLVADRTDKYEDSNGNSTDVAISVCQLEFGAMLYSPSLGIGGSGEECDHEDALTDEAALEWMMKEFGPKRQSDSAGSENEVDVYWLDIVAALKIRCVAAHGLQRALIDAINGFVPWLQQVNVSSLLNTLHFSRRMAEKAVQDEDLKFVFQEAILSEWGEGVEEVERALSNVARQSHLHGSDMFFLMQEAGATNAIFRILTLLMDGCIRKVDGLSETIGIEQGNLEVNHKEQVERLLLQTIKSVLGKFLESEKKDGHLIDPSAWRNTSENGGKVALYCTTFARVVEDILNMMVALTPEDFARHKHDFFPLICSLVRAQSEDIRHLVQRIFSVQVAAMIGVEPAQNGLE